VLLSTANRACADRFPADPVVELREALRSPIDELIRQDPAAAKQLASKGPTSAEWSQLIATVRLDAIRKRVEALHSLSQMHRALLLQDWQDQGTPGTGLSSLPGGNLGMDAFGLADRENRLLLTKRFHDEVQRTLSRAGPIAKLATIRMISEVAQTATQFEDRRNLVREFGTDLAKVVASGDAPDVRAAAARALGLVFPEPRVAVPPLSALLKSGTPAEREAAATGLLELIEGAIHPSAETAGTNPGRERASIVSVGTSLIPALIPGLSDTNTRVRRMSAQALELSAGALMSQVPTQRSAEDPQGMLGPIRREGVAELRQQLPPLLNAFRGQASALARASEDPDLQVRVAARRALEAIGESRHRLQQLPAGGGLLGPEPAGIDTLPPIPPNNGDGAGGQPPAPKPEADLDALLLDRMRAALPSLIAGLSDPAVEGRLAAIDALETYGPAGAEAAPALVRTLHDKTIAVRRAAVRALGKIGPAHLDETVPALAHLLGPAQDLDLRLSAALALERYGPAARDAVPPLVKATRASDSVMRVQAIHALEGIGTDSAPAIPALIAALKDADAPVREAAAHVLGRFGKLAHEAEPALRDVLNDSSAPVRQAASDALLNIIPLEK
jgi:HEAT repeat protein